jgi:hypothetical protein
LGFLFERPEGVTRGSEALEKIEFEKRPEAAQAFVLERVREFVADESAVAPAVRANEDAVTQGHAGGQWRAKTKRSHDRPKPGRHAAGHLIYSMQTNTLGVTDAKAASVSEQGIA